MPPTKRSVPPPARTPAVAARLRLAVTRLARRLRQEGSGATVSPTGMAVLASIARGGPLTLGELAAAERVQPPTVTAAVARLVEQGLVERRPDDSDRRVVRVRTTAAGRRLLAEERSRKEEYLDARLRGLRSEELDTLEDAAGILERLLEDDR